MKKGITRILSYISNYKCYVALAAICNVLLSIFTVVSIPLIIPFFQVLFDRSTVMNDSPEFWDITARLNYYFAGLIETSGKEKALMVVCLAVVIVFFLKNLFRYLALYFMAPMRNGIVRDIRKQLFDKFLNLPLGFYSDERKGDLLARMTVDVQEIEWSILNVIEAIFKSPLIIIGSIALMISISPSLTKFVFVLMLFTALVIGAVGKKLKKGSAKVQKSLGRMNSIVEETLSGFKIVKGFGAETAQAGTFSEENNYYRNMLTRLLRRRDMSSPLSEFLGISVVAVLLYYGSTQVLNNELAPEVFFAFIFAFYQVIEPSKSFSSAYYNIMKGMAAMDRVDEIMNTPDNVSVEKTDKESLDTIIRFADVTFSYPGTDNPAIKNLNVQIKKGEKIALVGSSGSGKTTFVDLLMGFYQAQSGSITIDETSAHTLSRIGKQNLFGLVTQSPLLFHGTIYDNILMGRIGYSIEEVKQAAQVAQAAEFIEKLPDTYYTNIGDAGVKLSGGQRQRITIARAILSNPPILVLDEATSALDSESEILVQKALSEIMQNRTAIIIAHRLSTIQHVDRILVMKDGTLVQSGNHNELLKSEGDYKKFVEMQTFGS